MEYFQIPVARIFRCNSTAARVILIAIILFLIISGLVIFNSRAVENILISYYSPFLYTPGLLAGAIIFFVVQKVNVLQKPWLWIFLGFFIIFISILFTGNFYNCENFYSYLIRPFWRPAAWIMFCFIIFISSIYKSSVVNTKVFTITLFGYIISGCFAIMCFHDYYGALVFNAIVTAVLLVIGKRITVASILFINITVALLFINPYLSHLTGFSTIFHAAERLIYCCHLPFMFFGETPFDYYCTFACNTISPLVYNGGVFIIISFFYGKAGAALLLLLYMAIIYTGICSAVKAGTKELSMFICLLTLAFSMYILIAASDCYGIASNEGAPFFNAGNSKNLFSFLLTGIIFKNLKNKPL